MRWGFAIAICASAARPGTSAPAPRAASPTRTSRRVGLACPAVLVVLSLAAADPKLRAQRRPRAVELGVCVQRRLIGPALEKSQAVGVDHALEDFELLAARLFHHLGATALVRFGQLRPFAGCCGDRDDESDGHRSVSLRRPNGGGRASVDPTGLCAVT